jgi:hypothetical protein
MTEVFKFHPEFCRRDTDKGADTDFDKVITDLAKAPGVPSGTLMNIHVWIKTFFKPWPELRWLVLKVVILTCSDSVCENRWSIEGWIHEIYEAGMLPWDIEMTVEEPLSDDEGGVPHDVSDSESESENDSD